MADRSRALGKKAGRMDGDGSRAGRAREIGKLWLQKKKKGEKLAWPGEEGLKRMVNL